MADRLQNKAALVTGGSSGNGRAIARQFADEGANVTIVDIREDPRLAETPTHKVIAEDGGEAQFVEGDVQNTDEIRSAIDATVDAYGSLDVMVNNAGIWWMEPMAEADEDGFQEMMDVNTKSVYFGSQVAANMMRDQPNGGSIINLSSVAGLAAFPQASIYSATKAAIANITRSVAIEEGENGIRANAINPGVIETALTTEDEQTAGEFLDMIPLGRDGQPEDVAGVATFLASDDAAYVTGHNLVVDGGMNASV